MTAIPFEPLPAGRLGLLVELLFGVKLIRPIVCPACGWRHHRARLKELQALAAGGTKQCGDCGRHIARRQVSR